MSVSHSGVCCTAAVWSSSDTAVACANVLAVAAVVVVVATGVNVKRLSSAFGALPPRSGVRGGNTTPGMGVAADGVSGAVGIAGGVVREEDRTDLIGTPGVTAPGSFRDFCCGVARATTGVAAASGNVDRRGAAVVGTDALIIGVAGVDIASGVIVPPWLSDMA